MDEKNFGWEKRILNEGGEKKGGTNPGKSPKRPSSPPPPVKPQK